VSADFLEGYFNLPAPEKPLQDLTWLLIELRAEQSACFKLALGIPDQHPTDGHRGQARVVPDRGAGSHFYQTLALAVPVLNFQALPDRVPVGKNLLERRETSSDQAWPAHSTSFAQRCGAKQACI
jgi:hypothetical protein